MTREVALKIALTACLTALAAVGRLYMVIIPNVAPVAPLSLLAGYLGGPVVGFLTGAMSMWLSDIFIGLGPWTIFTSLFMGIVGLTGHLISRVGYDRTLYAILSYLAVLIYDVGTSLSTIVLVGVDPIIAIVNLFLPVFFLGIPYPMGPIHEFTSSILFVLVLDGLRRFGGDELWRVRL